MRVHRVENRSEHAPVFIIDDSEVSKYLRNKLEMKVEVSVPVLEQEK